MGMLSITVIGWLLLKTQLALPQIVLDSLLASDSDQDSIYDHYETDTGIFVDAQDTGSDPYNADSDGDTINDGVEVNDLGMIRIR